LLVLIGATLALAQNVVRTADITVRGLKDTDFEAVIAEAKRLHAAKVSAEDAPKQASFGPYASWTRRAENAPGALRRV
jgi:hypothetical protein